MTILETIIAATAALIVLFLVGAVDRYDDRARKKEPPRIQDADEFESDDD